jgi:cysteine protease ATG4
MAVLKSSNYQTWKDNFKSLVSTLYYNGYGLSKTFDKESPIFPLYVFDVKIKDVIADEINLLLKSFLYMSYRSGFINLNNNGCGDYTSDCGWGCMLRCSQMILSKGLIKKKMLDCIQKENTIIDNEFMDAIRKETLCLFNDNYLNYKEIERHPDFKNFWKLYKELVDTNPEYNSICEIIPPYSIHILCKIGKCAGEYTSFIKMVKIFSTINSDLFNDINIIFFECGYISQKKLFTYFCEEYTEFDDNYLDVETYNTVNYIFKKGGIVFISFRLGLYNNIDSAYIKVIPKLFENFHNNLGFVSGKKDRAYYFIGVQNDKLIFVDPHYNQQTTNNSDKDYESYYTENLYLLDFKDLSSELTIGIGIFNKSQFNQFLQDLDWFVKNYKDINLISLE